jgi:RHS repeat-associated protein
VPSPDGRIIKIVSTSGGIASVSVTPSGVVADSATLAKLGITTAERQSLATLYSPGQTLWRVQITHFSPWDCNFPAGPPDGATSPDGKKPDDDDKDPCPEGGSIIECTTQVLGEQLAIVGAPFDLAYRSNRVRGYASGFTQRIRLTGPTLPPSITRVDLTVEVAGRRITQSFSPAANQSFHFKWDGLDAYGRRVTGGQQLRYTVGYVYPMAYLLSADQAAGFGLMCPGSPTTTGASACWLAPPIGFEGREITLPTTYQTIIGGVDEFAKGLGGWTPTIQHMYDRVGRILYEGNGTRRNADLLGGTAVFAGTGARGFSGDGGPATAATFSVITDIKAGPDGSVYIADRSNRRIRRIDKSGIISTFAGTGADGNAGDGGPAMQAQLYPQTLAVGPDGSVYVSTTDNVGSHGPRIKRISPSGIITTIAGNGILCTSYELPSRCGDDGPATQAQFYPIGLDIGPDGTIWVADGAFVLRRIGPDGIVHRVTGDTLGEYCGYGRPVSLHNPDPTCGENKLAAQGRFDGLYDLKTAPDGSLVLADGGNGIIWRVGIDGVFRRIAGTRIFGDTVHFAGDGGPATFARFNALESVVVDAEGNLFVADRQNGRIRRIGTDGIISTVAGNGFVASCCEAGGLPTQLNMRPNAMTIGSDGSLYVVDQDRNRVFALRGVLQSRVASEDGSEIYEFDGAGRHLRTLDGLTGRPIFTFAYSTGGLLLRVTDGDGNVTQIERNGAGSVTAIVSPFGQRTTVGLDANGYLASLTNPAQETIRVQHDSVGLLRSLTDAKNNPPHLFLYDSTGRLTRDTDPGAGYKTLVRQLSDTSMTATVTTTMGRATTHSLFRLSLGDTRRVTTDAAGISTTTIERANGTTATTQPDGTVSTTTIGPDPRLGMAAPITTQFSVVLPSGFSVSGRSSRVATLANPLDPTTLLTQTDSVIVNGAVARTEFNAAARTITEISPEGRQFVAVLDSAGRIAEERAPNEAPVKYTYGARSLLTSVQQAGRTVRYDYDSAGRVKTVVDPLGRIERYAYDSVGRVVQQTLPNLSTILYSYDANGNIASLTPPGQSPHTFKYTSTDLDSIYSPPAAGLTTPSTRFAYNLDHQLVQLTRPDSLTVQLRYDTGGRLDTLILPTGRVRFVYGAQTGQLLSMAGASGSPTATLGFAYDGSLPKASTWSGTIAGSVSATYDANLRLNTLSVNDANPVAFLYDRDNLLTSAGSLSIARQAASGRVTGSTLGGVTSTVAVDDSLMTLSRLSYAFGATTLFDASYVRDSIGRIVGITETVLGATNTRSFGYDSIGRLKQVRVGGVPVADYGYDANGNRTSLVTSSGSVAGVFDAQDRLLSYGANVYSYSSNGELTRKVSGTDTTRYVYDVVGNLLQVRLGNGSTIDYLVDPLNRRVGKKVNGVLARGFLYQGRLAPTAEVDGSNQVVARFVYGTRANVPDYMIKGGVTYRLVSDHLGSVRLVVDVATGNVAQRIDYDEFGRVTQNTSPDFQPFGYAGGMYDAMTGLVRFGARDYDAETGRWTSKDPVGFGGGQENLFAYVGNDPINATDPSGLRCRGIGRELTSFIPVFGPAWDTIDDVQDGEYGWAAIDASLAILDGIGVGELTKLGWKTGSHTWSATRKWLAKQGVAEPDQHVHHAFIDRNGWAKGRLDAIKNQWWNLKPLKPPPGYAMDDWHRMVDGRRPGLNALERAWHGWPDWTKPTGASAIGKAAKVGRSNGCGCR